MSWHLLRPKLDPDSDGDGLDDVVETNLGSYLSPSNTGTDPLLADSDGDGVDDGVEVDDGGFRRGDGSRTS